MHANLLTNREAAYLCRSLAGLLHAGISVSEGCYLLAQEKQEEAAQLLAQLCDALDEGTAFADALSHISCFPASTVGLIRAGEYSGKLEEALLACARFHETQDRTRRQLKNALEYPLLLLGLMVLVVGVLLIQVLPVFDSVYASLGTRLTGVSAGLLYLGQWLKQALPLLGVLALILAAVGVLLSRIPRCRTFLGSRLSLLRNDRGLRREFNNALFAQAFAMGISSGLTPEESADLGKQLLADAPSAAARCEKCLELLRGGEDLCKALTAGQLLPPSACRMLAVGLRSGNADRILEDIALRMQEDAELALQDRIGKIEPGLVLTASILVGSILLSVMLPLMEILTALG